MGKKMSEGGVVRRDLLEGMDEDGPGQGEYNFNVSRGVFLLLLISDGEHRGVRDNDRRRIGRSDATHDQRDRHCYLEIGV